MNTKIKYHIPFLFLLLLFNLSNAQKELNQIVFNTLNGDKIKIKDDTIFLNRKAKYRFQYDEIIYNSKRNKLLETNGSVFLFIEVNGAPNLDRLYAFKIYKDRVDSLVNAISSELTDLDKDGNLEFGGSDLTESYPSKDSMYYVPSHYFEIKNGTIVYDSSYTKSADIEMNGIYLAKPADKQGYCCIVIKKPSKMDHPELASINKLPREIRVVGKVLEVSHGSCGIWCKGGYIKVRLESNVPNFNFKSVYLITACLSLGVKPGAKVDVLARIHTGKETECYYKSFARPKNSEKMVFYQLSESETAKVH